MQYCINSPKNICTIWMKSMQNKQISKTCSFVTKAAFINLYYHKKKLSETFLLRAETIVAARNSDTLLFQGYKTQLNSYSRLSKYVNLWIEQGGTKKGAGVKKRSVDRDPLSLRSTDHVGQQLLMTWGWLTDVSVNGTLEISPPTDLSWELPLLGDTWVYLKFQLFEWKRALLYICTGLTIIRCCQKWIAEVNAEKSVIFLTDATSKFLFIKMHRHETITQVLQASLYPIGSFNKWIFNAK